MGCIMDDSTGSISDMKESENEICSEMEAES